MNKRDYAYLFHMQRYVKGVWEDAVSLEDYFDGLRYLSCDGLAKYGKIKNIYTETYAETDELRTYIPDKVARENTEINFRFLFIGDDRRELYHRFVEWISGYKLKFWDDLRGREVEMLLIDSIEPDEDNIKDGIKYIIVPFKFKNLRGQTTKHV